MRTSLIVLCLMAVAPAVAAEPWRVRVLSYNIHHAEGTDGKLDLDRIARVISAAEPDLVALQEVDYKTERGGGADELAELAKRTGLTPVAGDNIDYQGGRYGNAALVRGRVVSSKNRLLPHVSGEQRGVLQVEVAAAEGRPALGFFVTHLDHRREEAERVAGAKFINGLVAGSSIPAILAGDLNATPESDTLKTFGAAWQNPTEGKSLPTIPSDRPGRQIDFVLCRPPGAWRVVEAKVIEEPVASDHRPLLVVLEGRPE